MSYTKSNIYFLQVMLHRGILLEEECFKSIRKCHAIAEEAFDGDFMDFIGAINDELHPFNFKIRTGRCEVTGGTVYVLVSLAESELNKLGGSFSPGEVDFFTKIIEAVVQLEDQDYVGTVSSIDVLNIADSVSPKMSKSDARDVLHRFVDEKWMCNNAGRISLSSRTILELEQYLCDKFEGFVCTCPMCSNIVFQGRVCQEKDCGARVHHHCALNNLKRSNPKCFKCGKRWNAEKDGDETMDNIQSSSDTQEPSQVLHSRKRRHR